MTICVPSRSTTSFGVSSDCRTFFFFKWIVFRLIRRNTFPSSIRESTACPTLHTAQVYWIKMTVKTGKIRFGEAHKGDKKINVTNNCSAMSQNGPTKLGLYFGCCANVLRCRSPLYKHPKINGLQINNSRKNNGLQEICSIHTNPNDLVLIASKSLARRMALVVYSGM